MYTPSLREENGKAVGFTPLHPVLSNIKKLFSRQRSQNGDVTGFTLLELLIVIGIMVILGTVLVLVLNPAETLKKSRDNQRISDLATMKTALGLYVTNTTTPLLDNTSGNTTCENGSGTDTVYYSIGSDTTNITDTTVDGSADNGQVLAANVAKVDATGWIPVSFSGMTGGSPISNLPIDPTNTVTATPTSSDLVYRYQCDSNDLTFEIDAQLESTAYTSTDNKRAKDGGDNDNYYETGTKLTVLGTGTNF